MKKEQLQDAIGQIEDGILQEAQQMRGNTDGQAQEEGKPASGQPGAGRRTRYRRMAWAAVAGVAVLCGSIYGVYRHQKPGGKHTQKEIVQNNQGSTDVSLTPNEQYMVASPQYPDMVQYPDSEYDMDEYRKWSDSRKARSMKSQGCSEGFEKFFLETADTFLKGEKGKNRIYSPLNVYLASSLLAEVSDGGSRGQILGLLHEDRVETLRGKAQALWNASYCRDGLTTRLLANSFWMNENITYRQDTMDALANDYYASSFQGKMGSEAYSRALQDWVNSQTGNLLEEQAGQMEMEEGTVLRLVSTVYFQANWKSRAFDEKDTTQDVFHGENGDETCDFMHTMLVKGYRQGQGCSAARLDFEGDGGMWLILPEEGKTVDDLLEAGEWGKFLFQDGEMEQDGEYIVNLSMPKFDVSSKMDLKEGLQTLGVTDVFESGTADFSPVTDENLGIYVSAIDHAARVSVDEKGCTAAYTDIVLDAGGAAPANEVDFNLNRPFLFVIVGGDGLPLFTGVVNQP